MLQLEPLNTQRRVMHTQSGASFEIRRLSPEAYQALRNQSMKGDHVDAVLFAKKAAVKVIADWQNVAGECTEENKVRFGAAFAYNIVPWLVDEAMSLDQHITEEEAAGKGS
ncbi:MAG: hypothetical protein AB7P08_17225 [Burkholderiales bacterium]